MNAAILGPRLLEATAPPERRGIDRDAVAMLVTHRATGAQHHARFLDLPSFLEPGDLLVVNDSATMPAALTAMRASGERLQLHVATCIDSRLWLAEPRGAVAAGEEFRLPHGARATAVAPVDPPRPRLWYTAFRLPLSMADYLAANGEPIRYGYVTQRFPLRDYQTMFARARGSAEMPSAARPFTPRVVGALRERGVAIATITLHCGVSSFEAPELPPTEHFAVSHVAAEAIDETRRAGGRVIAVGTTVVRALESSLLDGRVVASSGWTDLVIDARHRVRGADGLLTGFHEPAATHLWMLEAFVDRALLDCAYAEAADRGYRYHEFGDVHLIL